jgi:hypothetical protein
MYIKFFDDCRSMKAKERKLEKHIKEITGIEGLFTRFTSSGFVHVRKSNIQEIF